MLDQCSRGVCVDLESQSFGDFVYSTGQFLEKPGTVQCACSAGNFKTSMKPSYFILAYRPEKSTCTTQVVGIIVNWTVSVIFKLLQT